MDFQYNRFFLLWEWEIRQDEKKSGLGFQAALSAVCGEDYFFCTYFKQSRVTATRMMIPEKTNCRLVSMPRMVRE